MKGLHGSETQRPTGGCGVLPSALRWMRVGFECCWAIGFFVFIGCWLDKVEDTSPGWMILGFFIGFGPDPNESMISQAQSVVTRPGVYDSQPGVSPSICEKPNRVSKWPKWQP